MAEDTLKSAKGSFGRNSVPTAIFSIKSSYSLMLASASSYSFDSTSGQPAQSFTRDAKVLRNLSTLGPTTKAQ